MYESAVCGLCAHMKHTRQRLSHILVLASLASAATFGAGHVAGAAAEQRADPSIAMFGDRQIDLRAGWGGAQACTTDGVTTECFATEAEMDVYLGTDAASDTGNVGGAQRVACSTSLRLYRDTGYGTPVVNVSTRLAIVSLASIGFDNMTSSYKVGACAATFYDGTAGGTVYPGNTAANAQSTSMTSGWDNRIGSAYLS